MKQMYFKYLSVNVQITGGVYVYIIHIFITELSMVVSLQLNTLQGDFFLLPSLQGELLVAEQSTR